MALILYTKDLDNFHEITHAISAQFVKYYNSIGKATLTLPMSAYNLSIVERGAVLYDTLRDMAFVVANYRIDTTASNITVNCYSTNWLLNGRVIAQKRTITDVESGIYDLVSENLRDLYRVTVADPAGLSGTTQAVMEGGQLLDSIMPVLGAAGIGHEMRWDHANARHVFTLYSGRDLTEGNSAVIFSDEFGTAKDLIVSSDDSAFKNRAYVPGTYEDGTQTVVRVDATEATENVREIWVTENIQQNTDEAQSAFLERLRQKGLEVLAQNVLRDTFSVSIEPSEYGVRFGLGDIVSCVSRRFGVQFNKRIDGVKYELDVRGEKVSLILGDQVLNVLSGVKR